jgi:catechol 2,3-dioxygenase-like lactoylglutathione lyase family enzyme
MITGAHAIIYSRDADADRAFLRDVLGFRGIDAGGGWLIFALPPAEVAVHPADENGRHELYLMCDDVEAVVRSLRARKVACSPVHEERWGALVEVTLPGGGRIGIYEPSHPRAPHRSPPGASRKRAAAPRTTRSTRGARQRRRS